MYDLVENFLPIELKQTFNNFKIENNDFSYGFHATTEFTCSSEKGKSIGTRPNHWMGNLVSLFGNFEGYLINDCGILDGVNNEFYGSDKNFFNENEYVLRSGGNYRNKAITRRVQAIVSERVMNKNMITPLYNLLCLYYLKSIDHKVLYDKEEHAYDNGHVFISNKQIFGDNYNNIEAEAFKHLVLKKLPNISYMRVVNNEEATMSETNIKVDSTEAFLRYGKNVTEEDVTILRYAFGEWKALSPLGIAHSRAICAQNVVLNTVRGFDDSCDPAEFDAIGVRSVLTTLVRENRLEADFYAAYSILMSTFTSPRPRTAESAAWLAKPIPIMLPKVDFILGLDPDVLLGGVPYISGAEVSNSHRAWAAAPGMIIHHSLMLNEAAYVQLSILHHAPAHAEVNFNTFVEHVTGGRGAAYMGVLADVALLSMAMGSNIIFPFMTKAGILRAYNLCEDMRISTLVSIKDINAPKFYNVMPMGSTKKITIKDVDYEAPISTEHHEALINMGVKKEIVEKMFVKKTKKIELVTNEFCVGDQAILHVTALPPILYPIYTYGIGSAIYLGADMNGLATFNFKYGDRNIACLSDIDSLARFMDITRMAGINMKAKDVNTGKLIDNWADNASGRYIYDDFGLATAKTFEVDADCVTERKQNWLLLPDFGGKVTISYTQSNRRFCIYNGDRHSQGGIHAKRLVYRGAFCSLDARRAIVKKEQVISSVINKINFKPIKLTDESDFYLMGLYIPDILPAIALTSRHQAGVTLEVEEDNPLEIQPLLDIQDL